jgi:hypothetical protein
MVAPAGWQRTMPPELKKSTDGSLTMSMHGGRWKLKI